MDLISVWHGDRYWSKILCGTIPIPLYDPNVKVIHFLCSVQFSMSVFAKSLMDLIHYWHNDRNLSKILHSSTIPTPVHDLKVKVTHLDLFLIYVKCFRCSFLQSLWWLWVMFGTNRHKNLKCFRKEKCNSSELSCPATGLICSWVTSESPKTLYIKFKTYIISF